jgi:hypothetical protein
MKARILGCSGGIDGRRLRTISLPHNNQIFEL